ncbi:tryptophan halogenase family protein [Sphingorhabdus sp.]|uniref:tryptophan halogenase family protein n=1 Tax=Sphingorhabdus sp. TaxID=1902408 RepID=UPI0039197846
MGNVPLRFVILGGGTAGWMAACLLAKKWPQHDIVVVESPDIGIIGVGEGSTPQLKAFFDTLGLAESEWMPKCNATYKAGISFHNWSERSGFEKYFHPFHTELDHFTLNQFFFHTRARRTGRNVEAHPDRFFLPARLAAERRAPLASADFPHNVGYGYHFDATLVGRTLRDHAVDALGVTHLERTVTQVQIDCAGHVQHLETQENDTIVGDFFVDCSGFGGTIIQKALHERFISFGDNLFNDAAVAMPTANDEGDIPSETKATALSTGWAWRIPLTNRAGNGYVYASRYLDADAAETELRRHLGLLESDVPARHLKMNVGRLERCWVGNCLAVGLSQGFIEPLEATALHIVQATVEGFFDAFEKGGGTNRYADDLNFALADRIEGIRDYIVAHYRMNQRTDSAYWRDNARNDALSDNLKGLMTAWFKGEDLTAEVHRLGIARYYSSLSWHCLFAGYGTFPPDEKLVASVEGLELANMEEVETFIAGHAAKFPSHRQALVQLKI